MKRLVGLLLLVLVVLGVVGAGVAWRTAVRPASTTASPVWFEIEPGASLKQVARALEAKGVVRHALGFEWVARIRGEENDVRAGRYLLSPGRPADAILDRLVRGEIEPVRIKFVEGIWLSEVAGLLADSLAVDSSDVVRLAGDPDFLRRHDVDAPSAEGYLFPDTYEFEGPETADEALARLLSAGRSVRDRWPTRPEEMDFTWSEILTLASIIESETGVADERFKVSAVYHRRLRKNMLLQADPTIIYGLGIRGHVLTRRDLDTDAPYNSYRRPGLPPTPIGNPGEAAIEAALFPDPECTALYFVAKPGGGHTFSDTYEQHLAAVRVWRNR